MKKNQPAESHYQKTRPLRVEGSYITWAIRSADRPCDFCRGIALGFSTKQVEKLINGDARIDGNSVDGFEYVEGGAA